MTRLRTLLLALVATACTAFEAPPSRGCSEAILTSYRESVATAQLNLAQSSSIFDGAPSSPAGSFMVASDAAFCRGAPRAVLCRGNPSKKALTLAEVTRIDATLRAEFHYVSDQALHGRSDWWTNNRTCGDCEDYALILSERLSAAGQAGYGMGLVIWSPAPGLGHATLVVATGDAGLVEVGVSPTETPHRFDWSRGRRAAMMQMDGERQWTIPLH